MASQPPKPSFSPSAWMRAAVDAGLFGPVLSAWPRKGHDSERRLRKSERDVLIILLMHAGSDGHAYPSARRIGGLAMLTEGPVRRSLARLRWLCLIQAAGATEGGVVVWRFMTPIPVERPLPHQLPPVRAKAPQAAFPTPDQASKLEADIARRRAGLTPEAKAIRLSEVREQLDKFRKK